MKDNVWMEYDEIRTAKDCTDKLRETTRGCRKLPYAGTIRTIEMNIDAMISELSRLEHQAKLAHPKAQVHFKIPNQLQIIKDAIFELEMDVVFEKLSNL